MVSVYFIVLTCFNIFLGRLSFRYDVEYVLSGILNYDVEIELWCLVVNMFETSTTLNGQMVRFPIVPNLYALLGMFRPNLYCCFPVNNGIGTFCFLDGSYRTYQGRCILLLHRITVRFLCWLPMDVGFKPNHVITWSSSCCSFLFLCSRIMCILLATYGDLSSKCDSGNL